MTAKYKQLIAALLAACLAIDLTACGGGGGGAVSVSDSGGGSDGGGGSSAQVEKPAISSQPAELSVVTGSTATFTVIAAGGGTLAYQWRKNGTDIPGATASTYTTPATSITDHGARFSVVVTNSVGTVTSNDAVLGVTDAAVAPTITTQPLAQMVTAGQTASFSVSASGTSPFGYQWKKNGTDIPGATANPYTTPATSITDHGARFSVVVTNSVGTVTSNDAVLGVTDAAVAPAITTQPLAQMVTAGQTASFSVSASGTSPFGYQWKKNGTDIPGATANPYTTPATSNGDIGAELAYSVVVTNSAGSATSSIARLTVTAAAVAPAITTQPLAQMVTAGQTASFSVSASGTSPFGYQWKKNGTDIPGATANPYTTPATSSADHGAQFSVVVTNSAGTATSNAAVLTVGPGISTQPASLSVIEGQSASFSVAATGNGELSYQWKKNGTDISDATSSSYTINATTSDDNDAQFSVVVTDSVGTVTSNPATLTLTVRYSQVAKASGGFYDRTECVKDLSTGLVWEGKNPSGSSSRDTETTYTHYDSNSSQQKYNTSIPNQAEIDASDNSLGHAKAVNTSALCGYTDWRMPTKEELQGIVLSGPSPTIDATWFPNTQGAGYWSSSPVEDDTYAAYIVFFYLGNLGSDYRYNGNYYVRLVR